MSRSKENKRWIEQTKIEKYGKFALEEDVSRLTGCRREHELISPDSQAFPSSSSGATDGKLERTETTYKTVWKGASIFHHNCVYTHKQTKKISSATFLRRSLLSVFCESLFLVWTFAFRQVWDCEKLITGHVVVLLFRLKFERAGVKVCRGNKIIYSY